MANVGITLISAMIVVAALAADAKRGRRDKNEDKETPTLDISFTNYGSSLGRESSGEKGELLAADREISGLRLSVIKKKKEENGNLNAYDKDVGQIKKGDSNMRLDNGVYGLAALIAVQKVF